MIKKAGMLLLVMGAAVLFCTGCNLIAAQKPKTEWKPAETVTRPPYIHTVKYPGETLRIISKWYTGDVNNWEALAEANPNINHEKMPAGSKIFIPENLLKTTEPLTEEYITSYNQEGKPVQEITPVVKEEEKKVPVSKPKPPPKKDEDFDLIGPK
jgi:hypothetical protein